MRPAGPFCLGGCGSGGRFTEGNWIVGELDTLGRSHEPFCGVHVLMCRGDFDSLFGFSGVRMTDWFAD